MKKLPKPKVKTEDAVKLAGNKSKLAKALGIKRPSVTRFGEFLPDLQACRIAMRYPEIAEFED